MIDYKKTLNLPYTQFPMKANLAVSEIATLKRWVDDDLYKKIRYKKKNKKKIFLLHDGPPYANGRIHLGHSVNKILKDIIIKYKGLSGYDAPYVPGWDCHGLPIELEVEKIIKESGINIDSYKFRDICRQYVIDQIELQKKDFIRLGVLGDWSNAYLTMNFNIEANIVRTLGKVIAGGYFYKGFKPVYWCFKCGSVLANAEVEYRNHFSCAVSVGFSVVNNFFVNKIFNVSLNEERIEMVIWTTTLWTLPSNQAISVHPDYMYRLIKIGDKYIIIASNLTNIFMNQIECSSWVTLGEVLGSALEYLKVSHPFMLFDVPVVLNRHITLDSGTGIVHIAPNHGEDDYWIAQKYNFKKIVNLIDNQGNYTINSCSKLNGVHIFQSNSIIIDLLRNSGCILYVQDNYQHSYPYCWRHVVPLIFKGTAQWFLNMDHNSLRKRILQVIKKVTWIPDKGRTHMRAMILNRPDWCLSRQRTWGIPIPVFIHKDTGSLHPDTSALIEKIAKIIEKNGIQAWWYLKTEDLLDHSEAACYKKVYDVLDVWFDSGSTHNSVIPQKIEYLDNKVIDLYLEGSDQYRGWFMSSLIISVMINNRAPYKSVLSHGFTIDSDGKKMSKSLGNTITPLELINKFGSDILRLWVASSDYSTDLVISDNVLKHVIDVYRRIRNTARFCLSNLNDFDPKKNMVQSKDMIALDRWAVDQTLSVQCRIIESYDKYQFHNVVQYIMKFCSIELGSFYLEVIKDRQYTLKKDSIARRSCQTTLYHIMESLVRWISPILSFTADEIWKYIPGDRSPYVFTEEWYNGLFKIDDCQMINNDYWNIFFNIRDQVNKMIEQARINGIIKRSLEADVVLYVTPIIAKQLRVLGNELIFGLMVSSVTILDNNISIIGSKQKDDCTKLKVIVRKTQGIKCERCWNYTIDIIQDKDFQNVCMRCVNNVSGLGENRRFF